MKASSPKSYGLHGLTKRCLEANYDVHGWQPRLLSAAEATFDFRTLTVKALRPSLFEIRNHYSPAASVAKNTTQLVAFGVNSPDIDKEPIGFLLASINHNTNEEDSQWESALSILSLAVKKPWRRQAVASSLLEASIQFANSNGLTGCCIDQPTTTDFASALENLFSEEKGWRLSSESVIFTLDCSTSGIIELQKRFQLASLHQQRQWGWHVEQYPSVLTPALKSRLLDPNIPKWARPIDLRQFPESDQVSPKHCRILRVENDVVGWLIAYHAGEDLIRYGKIWVDHLWQKRGGLVALLTDAVQAAHYPEVYSGSIDLTSSFKYKRGCCTYARENIAMRKFSEKHFRPVSAHWVEIARKTLRLKT